MRDEPSVSHDPALSHDPVPSHDPGLSHEPAPSQQPDPFDVITPAVAENGNGASVGDDVLTNGPDAEQPGGEQAGALRSKRFGPVLLVAAGVVTGIVGVSALQHRDATVDGQLAASQSAANQGLPPGFTQQGAAPQGSVPQQGTAPQGTVPQGTAPQGGLPPMGAGGPGGLQGEQRISGTVTAVGASTVTITTDAGTSTYSVTASSEIVRDGARATLADVEVGDPVFAHVYPSGSDLLVERLFAGEMPRRGGPGGPGQGGPPPSPGPTSSSV